MPKFWVYNGRYPNNCGVCKTPLVANQGVSEQTRGSYRNSYRHCCVKPDCLATMGENWIDFARENLGDPVKEIANMDGVWIARMKPFCRDSQSVLKQIGCRWNRVHNAYALPTDTSDRGAICQVLKDAGFDIPSEFSDISTDIEGMHDHLKHCESKGLYPFQLEGVQWLLSNTRCILGDDMGLGKTVQASMSLQGEPVIIITPASLKLNWKGELAHWRPDYRVHVVMGSSGYRKKDSEWSLKKFRMPQANEVVIVNFSQLPKSAQGLTGLENCTVIVDECQYLKNRKTSRTQRAKALIVRSKRAWGLTGTPMLNRQMDLWNTLDVFDLARRSFGNFDQFRDMMGGSYGRFGLIWAFGNVDESVPARLQKSILRRTKDMALPGLPSKLRNYQKMEIDSDLRKITDKLWDSFEKNRSVQDRREELLQQAQNIRAAHREYQELAQEHGHTPVSSGSGLGEEIGDIARLRAELALRKVPAAVELIEQFEEEGRPLVVFSAHVKPCDIIGDRHGWGKITGSTPNAKRQELVEQFQRGELKGIVGTISAMGTGLTLLTDVGVEDCDTAIFLDQSWLPAENAQAEDRICRIHKGGKVRERVNYLYMVYNHPIDLHVKRLVDDKQLTTDLSVGLASDIQIEWEDPKWAELRSQAAEIVNPVGVDLTDDEVADLLATADLKKRKALALGKWDVYGGRWESEGQKYAESVGGVSRQGHKITFDPLPLQLKLDIQRATDHLLGMCDGAISDDGMGFNAGDAPFFRTVHLGSLWGEFDAAYYVAWKRLKKYRTQCAGAGLDSIWTTRLV